jgi:hypothetical protein
MRTWWHECAVDPNSSSCAALSGVEDKAENMIVVVLRANGLVGQWELEGLERVLGQANGLLIL